MGTDLCPHAACLQPWGPPHSPAHTAQGSKRGLPRDLTAEPAASPPTPPRPRALPCAPAHPACPRNPSASDAGPLPHAVLTRPASHPLLGGRGGCQDSVWSRWPVRGPGAGIPGSSEQGGPEPGWQHLPACVGPGPGPSALLTAVSALDLSPLCCVLRAPSARRTRRKATPPSRNCILGGPASVSIRHPVIIGEMSPGPLAV